MTWDDPTLGMWADELLAATGRLLVFFTLLSVCFGFLRRRAVEAVTA